MRGVIERIYENQGKYGPFHKFIIGGDGYTVWKGGNDYREGDTVEFTFTRNGDFNVIDKGSLKKVESGGSSGSSYNPGVGRLRHPKERAEIALNSAFDRATTLVSAFIRGNATVGLGTSIKEAKAAVEDIAYSWAQMILDFGGDSANETQENKPEDQKPEGNTAEYLNALHKILNEKHGIKEGSEIIRVYIRKTFNKVDLSDLSVDEIKAFWKTINDGSDPGFPDQYLMGV